MPLNIGIDLCDDYITAYCHEEKSLISVQSVICREKKEDLWYIGETAYRTALSGKGVLTDKLLSLLKKGGTSTIARKPYTAEQLISRLFSTVLSQLINGSDLRDIERLVIALKNTEKSEMDAVLSAAENAGIDRKRITVISHQEAFIHYILSRDKELSYNMVGLFDLSGENLSYYKLKILRGTSKNSVTADGGELEEAFRIGILKNESGSELGDRIMTDVAKKCLGNDFYSSVFLTGKGFERTDWAKNFIEFICRKRRVLYEEGLFAIGAAVYAAGMYAGVQSDFNIFCDTRTSAAVSMEVMLNERRSRLIMIPHGESWYDVDTYAEVLTRQQDYVDIDIEPVDSRRPKRSMRIALTDFPERPDRCTRLSVQMHFVSAGEFSVKIEDRGFGELFPASDKYIEETIRI